MAYFRCTGEGGAPVPVVAEPYLYNTDLVYFNTGHTHTANTKVRLKGRFNWCYTYMQAFGARKGSFQTNAFGFFPTFASPRPCFYRTGEEKDGSNYWAGESNTTTMFFDSPVVIECEGNTAEWYKSNDPQTVHTVTASGSTVNAGIAPLALFGCNGANVSGEWWPVDGAIMVFYWAEIYENDVLVHRFVPAWHSGQYCLYDEVDQVYIYEAAGNYSRLHGSDDIPTT